MGTLPDDILLKIFKFTIGEKIDFHYPPSEQWHTLVHVCRRWRNLTFTSPRHLNLVLHFRCPDRSVREMLDIWPELPIFVHDLDHSSKEARDDLVAVLGLNHRVSGIRLNYVSDLAWETFAPLMQHSFPALIYLWIQQYFPERVISRSFLGGSAPSLQDLALIGIPFPPLPELLLPSTNLIRLRYDSIPRSGYISPQAMVTGLSALTRLESLSLTFRSPGDLPDRAIRIPPSHTRTLLPALTYLCFQGTPEYVEDLVAQIDAPSLESVKIVLFDQEVLEVPELAKFIRRADKLSSPQQGEVNFESDFISVRLSPKLLLAKFDPKTLMLNLACDESVLRLSCVTQFCASCLPTPSPFESLHIDVSIFHTWQDVIDDLGPQWLDLLRLFNTVKNLRLAKAVGLHVALALRGLLVGQVTEVLPALENVFISGLEPSGPVQEAISEFADARQLSGHPVSVHGWKRFTWEHKDLDRGVDG